MRYSRSLPANDHVKVAVFLFGPDPKLVQEFTDPQKFELIESLQTIDGKPSYAKALHAGLDYYNSHKRSDARGVFIIVGDGESTDKQEERPLALKLVRKAKNFAKELLRLATLRQTEQCVETRKPRTTKTIPTTTESTTLETAPISLAPTPTFRMFL
uniref:VWFA domain-containing protein n=1 Tax=Panagrolaimus sp. PS1159 TaxID=55785 RepID=A0AC35GC95_9BILA